MSNVCDYLVIRVMQKYMQHGQNSKIVSIA